MAEFHAIPIPLGGATVAGTSAGFSFSPGRKFELLGVRMSGLSAITGHAANHCAFTVLGSDETTEIWDYSTDSDEDGTTVAKAILYTSDEEAPGGAGDTAKDFEAAETKTLRTYDANQSLIVKATKGGSGVSIGDTGVTIIIRYL